MPYTFEHVPPDRIPANVAILIVPIIAFGWYCGWQEPAVDWLLPIQTIAKNPLEVLCLRSLPPLRYKGALEAGLAGGFVTHYFDPISTIVDSSTSLIVARNAETL